MSLSESQSQLEIGFLFVSEGGGTDTSVSCFRALLGDGVSLQWVPVGPSIEYDDPLEKHHVHALLMGGQACVLYGAAEFSRDVDLAILADSRNLNRLRKALSDLQTEQIAVPAFDPSFLRRSHAIHFHSQRN